MTAANGRSDAANRIPITISIMLATIMTSLDTTIANVALPHVQGSVSASAEQITWVLTSYMLATAIGTPLTGVLADRLGRKQLFVITITGFTITSALCGLATGLIEIVAFRFLQGAFGAALIPLSQAVLLDINPPERHGQAMAMWGAGAVLGPVLGPGLGGWLTDALSWRWVFYINLPVGILALAGVLFFMSEKKGETRPFDMLGFASLAVAIAAIQMVLDRGPSQDWFYSLEINIYAVIFVMSLWVFGVQIFTARHPFIAMPILKDKNFMMATVFGFFFGILMFSGMALLPPMMQTLLGYPVAYSGLVSMPRGIGSFISMILVGQIIARVNVRLILTTGIALTGISMWQMTNFNLQMDSSLIEISGFLQGLGTGLVFIPLNMIAYSTISPALRAEAAGFYTLIRNIGSSVGISIMQAHYVSGISTARSALVEHARPDNPLYQAYLANGFSNEQAIAMLNAEVLRQSMMMSYVDSFMVLLGVCLVCAVMIPLMRTPKAQRVDPAHAAVE
jgi:DHA2 family multidrug resistance protein